MDSRQTDHIQSLSKVIENTCKEYLINNFESGSENLNFILNLVFSSFLTGCFNVMSKVSEQNEKIQEETEKFINALINFLKENEFIQSATMEKREK